MKQYKFKINGSSYHIHIKDATDNIIQVEVNGSPYEVVMETQVKKTSKTPTLIRTEPRLTHKVDALTSSDTMKTVLSPLPGIVLEILVKEGGVVKMGDKLLVLEAMKMENMILAETSGTIAAIKVAARSTVLQGDILLEIL